MLRQKVLFKNPTYLVEWGALTKSGERNNFLRSSSWGELDCPFIMRHRLSESIILKLLITILIKTIFSIRTLLLLLSLLGY